MADKPILFSAPMIQAIMGGRKTQTRRVLTAATWDNEPVAYVANGVISALDENDEPYRWPRTHAAGDHLWVREEHFRFGHWEPVQDRQTRTGRQKWAFVADTDDVLFDAPQSFRGGRHHADPATPAWHKRHARFMFRKHSRLTLIVTDVRVVRLQDITEADAVAEGICQLATAGDMRTGGMAWGAVPDSAPDEAPFWVIEDGRADDNDSDVPITLDAREAFQSLWDSINGPDAWHDNPWVAAYAFDAYACNIDAFDQAKRIAA